MSTAPFGFLRVAAASPRVWVADPARNVEEVVRMVEEARGKGAQLLVFPELGLTGYTCGDLFFAVEAEPGVVLGVEICEDLWAAGPPSSFHALAGATVLANLSASNELVAKAEYRRELVLVQSGRALAAYVYANNGVHESTTDVVFGGQLLIAENAVLLSEGRRFRREGELVVTDADTERLQLERARQTSFSDGVHVLPKGYRRLAL